MRQVFSAILGCLALFAIGHAAPANQGDPGGKAPQAPPAYVRIDLGDQLVVTVVSYPDLSNECEVASDGTISGPGFGVVRVAGKTLLEAADLVREKLKSRLVDPQVYVSFKTQRPKVVYLIGVTPDPHAADGLVHVPQGQIPLTNGTTVRSLLAGAILSERADRLEVAVIRDSDTIHVDDLGKLLDGDPAQFDGPLQPNDVVVVRAKPMVKVWLVGAFRLPGDHLVPAGATLAQAISYAGGYDTSITATGQPDLAREFLARCSLRVRRGTAVTTVGATAGSRGEEMVVESGDTITLVQPKSVNVTVAGFAAHVGEVIADSDGGLLAAISKAGGPDERGGLDGVLVYRQDAMYRFDLNSVARGKPQPKFQLQPDDLIYVPENRRFVQVLGSVAKSGVQYLPIDGRPYRASEALAQAGGLNPEGTLRRMALLRPDASGKYVAKAYNLDEFLKDGKIAANPELRPGDVLFFGTPKGISATGLIQALTIAALINSIRP